MLRRKDRRSSSRSQLVCGTVPSVTKTSFSLRPDTPQYESILRLKTDTTSQKTLDLPMPTSTTKPNSSTEASTKNAQSSNVTDIARSRKQTSHISDIFHLTVPPQKVPDNFKPTHTKAPFFTVSTTLPTKTVQIDTGEPQTVPHTQTLRRCVSEAGYMRPTSASLNKKITFVMNTDDSARKSLREGECEKIEGQSSHSTLSSTHQKLRGFLDDQEFVFRAFRRVYNDLIKKHGSIGEAVEKIPRKNGRFMNYDECAVAFNSAEKSEFQADISQKTEERKSYHLSRLLSAEERKVMLCFLDREQTGKISVKRLQRVIEMASVPRKFQIYFHNANVGSLNSGESKDAKSESNHFSWNATHLPLTKEERRERMFRCESERLFSLPTKYDSSSDDDTLSEPELPTTEKQRSNRLRIRLRPQTADPTDFADSKTLRHLRNHKHIIFPEPTSPVYDHTGFDRSEEAHRSIYASDGQRRNLARQARVRRLQEYEERLHKYAHSEPSIEEKSTKRMVSKTRQLQWYQERVHGPLFNHSYEYDESNHRARVLKYKKNGGPLAIPAW